jgi:hypothetical protein
LEAQGTLKIKIFVWFLIKGVVLTKDNLLKRNWKGDEKCCFCNNKETFEHLFFECHVARFIWRTAHIAFGLQPPRDMTSFFPNMVTTSRLKVATSDSSRSKRNILVYMIDQK